MTINLGGAPIKDVRVAGVQAQRVMLGTGTSAVEVWSAKPPVSPAAFGAVHWLPFTPEPTTDLGTQPRTWETYGTVNVADGALTSGRVRYPDNSAYTPIAGCAMTYWVKHTSSLNSLGANAFEARADYSEMRQNIHGATRAVRWRFGRGGTSAQSLDAGTVPLGVWTFIAACMEPVSGTTWRYRGYINGNQVVNNTYNAGVQHPVTWVELQVNPQDGHVDDAAVYNRALTAEEITALYEIGRTT